MERQLLGRIKGAVSRPRKIKIFFLASHLKTNYLSFMSDELKDLYHIDTLEALAMLGEVTERFEQLAIRTGENAQAFIEELREIKIEK